MSIFGPNGKPVSKSYPLGSDSIEVNKSHAELKMSFYQEPVRCRKCGVQGTIPARQSHLQPLQLPKECPKCGALGGLALADPTGNTRLPNAMALGSLTWMCASEEAHSLREKIDGLSRRIDSIDRAIERLADDIESIGDVVGSLRSAQ